MAIPPLEATKIWKKIMEFLEGRHFFIQVDPHMQKSPAFVTSLFWLTFCCYQKDIPKLRKKNMVDFQGALPALPKETSQQPALVFFSNEWWKNKHHVFCVQIGFEAVGLNLQFHLSFHFFCIGHGCDFIHFSNTKKSNIWGKLGKFGINLWVQPMWRSGILGGRLHLSGSQSPGLLGKGEGVSSLVWNPWFSGKIPAISQRNWPKKSENRLLSPTKSFHKALFFGKKGLAKRFCFKETRWWQLKDFVFSSLPGGMIQFDSYFSNGLVQPPTRKTMTSKRNTPGDFFGFGVSNRPRLKISQRPPPLPSASVVWRKATSGAAVEPTGVMLWDENTTQL